MELEKIKERLKRNAVKDDKWIHNAKWRQSNAEWLEVSAAIALKILKFLRENRISQKELAKDLDWSPQYLNKIVKGSENLTLETICKIQNRIGVSLIEVPDEKR